MSDETNKQAWEQANLGVGLSNGTETRCLSVLNVAETFSPAPAEVYVPQGSSIKNETKERCVFCGKPVENKHNAMVQVVFDGYRKQGEGQVMKKKPGKVIFWHDVCDVPDASAEQARWELLMELWHGGVRTLVSRADETAIWSFQPDKNGKVLMCDGKDYSVDEIFSQYYPSSKELCEIPRTLWSVTASSFARAVRQAWDWQALLLLVAGGVLEHLETGAHFRVLETREDSHGGEVCLVDPLFNNGVWFSTWQVLRLFRAVEPV